MSNTKLIIEERAADIGNFMVGRLLPFRQKRMVGPFIFIDHMGPAILKPNENMDVDMHPHIGLSTLTYLFEGAVFHRDSLGTAIEIKPGAVRSDGKTYNSKQTLVAKDSTLCAFEMETNTTVYIFGGEAFPEERFIEWNFVASDKALIEKAKKDWNSNKFPGVPNETKRATMPRPKSLKY